MNIYKALAELEEGGGGGVLCTVVHSQGSTPRHAGSKMLVYPDGRFIGSVGGGEMESRVIREALDAFQKGETRKLTYSMVDPKQGDPGICGGTVEIFLEPMNTKHRLIIVGGGHVGKAVAHLGKWLGFRVAISDDRLEYCNKEANPDADEFYPVALKDLPEATDIGPNDYLILTTRGVPIDVPGMPAILNTNAKYVGVIGSKKRWLTTRKALIEQGIPVETLDKVYSPIGIELGAETPEEIAVSILAEVMMVRNRASGKTMQYRG